MLAQIHASLSHSEYKQIKMKKILLAFIIHIKSMLFSILIQYLSQEIKTNMQAILGLQ